MATPEQLERIVVMWKDSVPLHEEPTAVDGELRPRMSHESLLADGLVPVEQGGSHFLNNVLGNYN